MYCTLLFQFIIDPIDCVQILLGGLGPAAEPILNSAPLLETFIFMSGFLVAFVTLNQLERSKFNLKHYYLRRVLRSVLYVLIRKNFLARNPYESSFLSHKDDLAEIQTFKTNSKN